VKTSRQRVLEYIRTRRVVGVTELSRVLKMTPANARHHLGILMEQGLVQVVGEIPPAGRGRPAQLFSLSEQVQSHNLAMLSAVALDELLAILGPAQVEQVAQRLANRLVSPAADARQEPDSTMDNKRPASRSQTQAITNTVQRLNALHYQARWEAHAQGPRLILGHCPYAAILPDHPELCRMDGHLLSLMLGREVRQAAKLAADPQGATYCLFLIRQD
jgi:predicted ArsR family transcriptional regulator